MTRLQGIVRPFTREFGLGGVDGILASLTAIVCLLVGLLRGDATRNG